MIKNKEKTLAELCEAATQGPLKAPGLLCFDDEACPDLIRGWVKAGIGQKEVDEPTALFKHQADAELWAASRDAIVKLQAVISSAKQACDFDCRDLPFPEQPTADMSVEWRERYTRIWQANMQAYKLLTGLTSSGNED